MKFISTEYWKGHCFVIENEDKFKVNHWKRRKHLGEYKFNTVVDALCWISLTKDNQRRIK